MLMNRICQLISFQEFSFHNTIAVFYKLLLLWPYQIVIPTIRCYLEFLLFILVIMDVRVYTLLLCVLPKTIIPMTKVDLLSLFVCLYKSDWIDYLVIHSVSLYRKRTHLKEKNRYNLFHQYHPNG